MNCSPAFKWFIALLLPFTFTWKLAVGPEDSNEPPRTIAQFLSQREFEDVKTEQVMDGNMWMVRARKGECRLFVVEVWSNVWTRKLMRTFAEAPDKLFIVFHGSVYENNPSWMTATKVIYYRALRKLGLTRSALIVGVAASPNCSAERLPWNEL